MKRLALAACLSAALGAWPNAPDVIPPRLEVQVAKLTVLKKARTIKAGFLFESPSQKSAIIKSVPPGTRLQAGEEIGTRTEVWVENVGSGWMPTSIIQFESEPVPK